MTRAGDKRWADWLHHPCRLRDPQRFTAGDKISSNPHVVDILATSFLSSSRSQTLHSGGKNQKWPTSGQTAHITSAIYNIPNA